MTLRVSSLSPAWECSGEKDLGLPSGGVYTSRGRSDGAEFVCEYDSAYDAGTFRLNRPAATSQTAGK